MFMYDIPNDLIKPQGLTCEEKDMYYTEILIPKLLHKTHYLTNDPKEANFFFVPQYISCFFHRCLLWGNKPDDCSERSNGYITNILRHIQEEHPFWNLSKGVDHVFVFSWDRGMGVVGQNIPIKEELRNAIHLTPYGKLVYIDFDSHKDITIPPFVDPDVILRKRRNLIKRTPINEREIWAIFRGTIHKEYHYSYGVRQGLRVLAQEHSQLKVYEGASPEYFEELSRTTFSLCPSGWSPWSPRFFDSLAMESIPVLYANDIQLPFEQYFNYTQFIIKIMDNQVNSTIDILKSYSSQELEKKREKISQVWKHFLFFNSPRKYDALWYTMKSLEQKVYPYPRVGGRSLH